MNAYQTSNNAYQGNGVFVYQGGISVVTQRPGGGKRPKRRRLKTPAFVPEEAVVIEAVPQNYPVPRETLEEVLYKQALTYAEKQQVDLIEEEDDDMLVLTSRLLQ
jgi:hypothetical protein